MSDQDWAHVERMLNIIEMLSGHGTTYSVITAAAHKELAQINANLQSGGDDGDA